MRNYILKVIDRNARATPDEVVREMRSDATLTVGGFTPMWLLKAIAWVKTPAALVRYHLNKMEQEKLVAQHQSRFYLTAQGRNQLNPGW